MKKFFTLALTLFILNAAFSQTVVSRFSVQTPNFDINYNRNYGNGYGNYSNSDNERIYRIEHVKAIYEQKMHEVMCMPIEAGRKVELIRELQFEKAEKIRHINAYYFGNGYNNDNRYNNRYYNDDDNWRR